MSRVLLRQADMAIEAFEHSLREWLDDRQMRDRGVCLARLAAATASVGNVERACEAGEQALAIAQTTGSARVRAHLITAYNELSVAKLVLVNRHGGNYVVQNVVREATISGPHMALFPSSGDWVKAREAAGLVTTDHKDMHAGELETSILLDGCPGIIRDGYQSGDHLADSRSHLLTRGMQEYTESGIIGRPSLASAAKGKAAMASLIQSSGECMRSMTAS